MSKLHALPGPGAPLVLLGAAETRAPTGSLPIALYSPFVHLGRMTDTAEKPGASLRGVGLRFRHILLAALLLNAFLLPPPAVAQPADRSEIVGALPLVRLFCSPCDDRYAHQMAALRVRWGIESEGAPAKGDPPRPVGPVWERRSSGALRISSPPPVSPGERRVLLISGSRFEVAHVYVFLKDSWQNVAAYFGIEAGGARPELPGSIPVQPAPFKEAPSYDDRLFWFY